MSLTSKSADWIDALNEAVNLQFPAGIRGAIGIPELVSDHGSQPTSTAFFKACSELGIQQIFASYCNPKGNADMERVIRPELKGVIPWRRKLEAFGLPLKELCLRYLLAQPGRVSVLFGVDTQEQLRENLALAEKGALDDGLCRQVASTVPLLPETLIRPHLWPH